MNSSPAQPSQLEQLKRSRLIGVAIGLTMSRFAINREAALEHLTRESQTRGVSLHAIARRVIQQEERRMRR